jgi:hypothetical protein
MAVIASATGVALGMTAGTIGAGLVGGAVLGAGIGGLYSAITGDGDILNSMLTGGLLGSAAGGLGAAYAAPAAAGATGTGAAGAAASTVNTVTPAMEAASLLEAAAVAEGGAQAGMVSQYAAQEAAAKLAAEEIAKKTAATALTNKEVLGYGLAGTAAMQMLGGKGTGANAPTDPGTVRPYTFSSNPTAATGNFPSPYATAEYDAAGMPILDTRERNYFDQKYAAQTPYSAKIGTVNPNVPVSAARGGLMAAGGPVERMSQNVMGGLGNMYPQSQQPVTSFATPTQMPVSAEIVRSDYNSQTRPYSGITMANGGLSKAGGLRNTKTFSVGGVSYDPQTQKYSGTGIAQAPAAPAVNLPPLAADLVSSLTPQWQAANPYKYAYDPKAQKYSAATPDMNQLHAFKAEQDRVAAEAAAAAAASQGYQSYAMGGDVMGHGLGGYSDGGRLLRGPGDGVSDDIPATIAGKQPARLADGEFVIPARIVSEIGNGSTDAGAKRLYAMMDRIQDGRKKTIGKKNIAKDTKAKKHLLA